MRSRLFPILLCAGAILGGCTKKSTKLVDRTKTIPLLGAHDTILAERSAYWQGKERASIDTNRQQITFSPSGKLIYFATLENMGGVPLKRDTIRAEKSLRLEDYLQTVTKDTNLQLHIESNDRTKTPSEIVIYIRNHPDSVYQKIILQGQK